MKKVISLVLALAMCLSLCACDGGMPNANDSSKIQGEKEQVSNPTDQNSQNNTENITESTESPYVNHPLTAYLYGEWELPEKESYDQHEEIPCSTLTINEDGTCVADGVVGFWKFSEKTNEKYLQIDIFINDEHRMCVAPFDYINAIGVWSAGYGEGLPVDTSWKNKSA